MLIVEPESFAARLAAVGFIGVSVEAAKRTFCFRVRLPKAKLIYEGARNGSND